jgi:DNA-binding PucR family transcriptional regulator
MALALSEVLELEVLKKAVHHNPSLKAAHTVEGVSVIEVPVENFVRSGEFVLSTAVTLGRDEKRLLRFVQDVAGLGASALAIATGKHVKRVSEKVVQTASHHNLPLIELPWEVRFSDITEAILRKSLEQQLESRRRDEFVWSLASGTLTPEYAHARAKTYGIALNEPYIIAVGQVALQQETTQKLLSLLQQLAARERLPQLSSLLGQQLLLCVSVKKEELLETFLSKVQRLSGLDITWGVSEVSSDPSTFVRRYHESKLACEIGYAVRGQNSITHAEDVALEHLLLRLSISLESRKLHERYVSPLEDSSVPLLETLRVYLECLGNVSKAAKRLGVHRQTLLYRLRLVEEKTGCSLQNNRDVFTLELSLRLQALKQP